MAPQGDRRLKGVPERNFDGKPPKQTGGKGPILTPRMQAITSSIDEMARMRESSITMCHAQGKTAVYLSEDGKYIVEHPPYGEPKRTPFRTATNQ